MEETLDQDTLTAILSNDLALSAASMILRESGDPFLARTVGALDNFLRDCGVELGLGLDVQQAAVTPQPPPPLPAVSHARQLEAQYEPTSYQRLAIINDVVTALQTMPYQDKKVMRCLYRLRAKTACFRSQRMRYRPETFKYSH